MASLVLNETGMEDCGIDDSFKYNLYSVVYGVVFVLGLITNCAALFVFCFRMKMRNETTMFMTNLALSDLVFVFTLPFKVFYNVNRHWPFGDGLCKVSGTAFITNIYGSMLFLTCISVDRFLAIVYPFRSRSVRTRRNAALVCAAVWLTIVGGGISVTFFSTINSTNRATTCFEGFSKTTWRTYLSKITIFIEIVGFLLPLLANLVCSSLVLRTLRRPVTVGHHGCDSKRRVLRMILVHLGIFIICFVPYNSILFLYALVRTQALANCAVERFARTLYPITLCLASLNCCLDPVVYYFTSESFQKSLTLGAKGSGVTVRMSLNASWDEPQLYSGCGHNMTSWNQLMDKMYTYFYLLLFIPGLLLNTIALWVLCRHISKNTKAVIFMINLAVADLAHILSLPLRIYYYYTHAWPFGRGVCLFCFYLKYLNMYAAIVFLVCISVQRCIFLLKPFIARWWRRRYDVLISVFLWLVVGAACTPFIFMRSSSKSSIFSQSCFKDLPMRHLSLSLTITIMVFAELCGFLIPLVCISYSSFCICRSLNQVQEQSRRSHEKRRALRMVMSCSGLFLLCFAPYHINFLLYLMVSQNIISHCTMSLAVRQFHPVSLCLASLSCCLNPLLYYFLTAEFRLHLNIRSPSLLSSPHSSTSHHPAPQRLMSAESSFSDRE
ncbi:uncharacterized protein LOC144742283 [Lampetra planeri]